MTITAPHGFRASGVSAGLKAGERPDVALVVNDGPSDVAAAVFTTNRCKANPVVWSEDVITDRRAGAVVLNSGGANCHAGPHGFAHTRASAERTADGLGLDPMDVLVCSTGLIGEPLDIDKLGTGIDHALAALSPYEGDSAATAIMTTDTHPKQAVREGTGYRVGGMAKGAGMLAPELATMLVVLTTDALIDTDVADSALREATRMTFDRLDSDGCLSTNDTVILMSSGASGRRPDTAEFTGQLLGVCRDLGRQLLGDAEGAEHDIAVEVRNAADEEDALTVGRAIAGSNLFKCAVFGRDPNWGRILASMGTTQAVFDPGTVDIAFNGVWVCRDGEPGEPREKVDLSHRDVQVSVDLKSGPESATIWTNDLTYEYVRENAEYST